MQGPDCVVGGLVSIAAAPSRCSAAAERARFCSGSFAPPSPRAGLRQRRLPAFLAHTDTAKKPEKFFPPVHCGLSLYLVTAVMPMARSERGAAARDSVCGCHSVGPGQYSFIVGAEPHRLA